MDINEVKEKLSKTVLPVLSVKNENRTDEICKYLIENGYRAVEVTYRTNNASEVIHKIKRDYGLLVAAGTVLDCDTAAEAAECGADFIVSPGLSESVARACKKIGIPYIPGVETASEIMKAISLSLDFVKFFPAEACGGIGKIKALAAPFPNLKFMPTGGITAENAESYLKLNCVLCVGGTYVVPKEMLS